MAVASAGNMQVCTSLQTDNHASTPPLSFFTGRMPFLSPNQQRHSTEVFVRVKGKNSLYSTGELRVPELIQIVGSQPAGDVSHKPGGGLPLLSARPAVSLATLKKAATKFRCLGEQRHDGCKQFA